MVNSLWVIIGVPILFISHLKLGTKIRLVTSHGYGTMAVKFSSNLVYNNSEVHEQAISSSDAIHHERRILLKQEIGRMVFFFTDQPSLLAPNIQVLSVCIMLFAFSPKTSPAKC